MSLLLTIIVLILYTVLDAIEQSIDHHSGARTLCDFWHLTRLLSRVSLFVLGYLSLHVMFTYHLGLLILIGIAWLTVPLKFFVWNQTYHDYASLWLTTDMQMQIDLGNAHLNKFFGFDKNS